MDIGKAKYHFFIYSSLAAVGILALIGAVLEVQKIYNRWKGHAASLIDWNKVSVTDFFVVMYAVEIVISYICSDYQKEALWGTEGWYIGLVLLLTLCALYFLISRLWDGRKVIWYISIAVSGIVFLLGILDRFSIYLIPLEVRQPTFISTLGNINWFCGYLSVLAPIGICQFLFQESSWKKWVCGGYTIIAFMAGFCQGSSSIFLIFGALFYMLLWIAVKKRTWFLDYFLLLSMWGFSAQIARLLRMILADGYNYDPNNLCVYLIDSNLTLAVGIAALAVYLFFRIKKRGYIKEAYQKIIHRIMIGGAVCGVLLWLSVSMINTRAGIPGLEQIEYLLLNDSWGNGRGAAISSGLKMYKQMPVFHKLFGIGPDCFSAYAYSLPEIVTKLESVFGNNRLTNAHNELLTGLINTGAFGVLFYMGIFISFLKRCMQRGEEDSSLYLFAVCVVCYFIHNIVSFAQVLSLPFVFLILGLGEAHRRRRS